MEKALHFIVEASREKWTNQPLCEALDSNEALDGTTDVISAKQYKPRYKFRLEVLHFRDTSFEASVSFVTSLVFSSVNPVLAAFIKLHHPAIFVSSAIPWHTRCLAT